MLRPRCFLLVPGSIFNSMIAVAGTIRALTLLERAAIYTKNAGSRQKQSVTSSCGKRCQYEEWWPQAERKDICAASSVRNKFFVI